MKYKLSVVIPTYKKHHKYLDRAINSIDMFGAEVIVVNNDAENPIETDGTVNLINLNKTVEVGKARNIGVNNSNSDLIVYLDSDDFFLPGALEKMYNHYLKHKCIIYGDLIRGENNKLKQVGHQYRGVNVKQSALHKEDIEIPYCLLIPKEWHYKIGGFNEILPTWEDVEYICKFWCYGLKAEHCGSIIYYYTYNSDGRLQLAKNKEIRETAKKIIYNNLRDYYKGLKETGFMGCSTCGKKNHPKPQPRIQSKTVQFNSRTIEEDEIGYIVYVGQQPTTTVGKYRFHASKNHRKKRITNNTDFNPTHEVHISDVDELLNLEFRQGKLFRFEKEIIVPKEALKEIKLRPIKEDIKKAVLEELPNNHPNIETFSIKSLGNYVLQNNIKPMDVEMWLEQEKSGKQRKGMLKLLQEQL